MPLPRVFLRKWTQRTRHTNSTFLTDYHYAVRITDKIAYKRTMFEKKLQFLQKKKQTPKPWINTLSRCLRVYLWAMIFPENGFKMLLFLLSLRKDKLYTSHSWLPYNLKKWSMSTDSKCHLIYKQLFWFTTLIKNLTQEFSRANIITLTPVSVVWVSSEKLSDLNLCIWEIGRYQNFQNNDKHSHT